MYAGIRQQDLSDNYLQQILKILAPIRHSDGIIREELVKQLQTAGAKYTMMHMSYQEKKLGFPTDVKKTSITGEVLAKFGLLLNNLLEVSSTIQRVGQE